jgi:hypothetical protein
LGTAALRGNIGSDRVAVALHQTLPSAKGLDAALLTAGGKPAQQVIAALREGGRAAYPNGVEDAPQARDGVKVMSYNGGTRSSDVPQAE